MNKQFRVWDGKKFLAADSFCLFPEDDGTFAPRKLGAYGSLEDIPSAVTQQFTGFLDKNGQKIFEGDIVEVDGIPDYRIEFRGMGFWFVDKEDDSCWVFSNSAYDVKVIGNIFENHRTP